MAVGDPNAHVRSFRKVMMSANRFAAALLVTLAFAASGAFAQTTFTSDPPASFTLPNGLQVVVIEPHVQRTGWRRSIVP